MKKLMILLMTSVLFLTQHTVVAKQQEQEKKVLFKKEIVDEKLMLPGEEFAFLQAEVAEFAAEEARKAEAEAERKRQELYAQFEPMNIGACSTQGINKTYMDYRAVTNVASTQYHYLRNVLSVNYSNGLMYDSEGYIGVALGSIFGAIGTKYAIEFENGHVMKAIKVDEKSDAHTINGCVHANDGSMVEFVVDTQTMSPAAKQMGSYHIEPQYSGKVTRMWRKK